MTTFDFIDPERTDPLGSETLKKREVPPRLHDLRVGASLYRVDEGLATAINVALTIGAPLLVTGEPGTGKTQLAYYLAWYFGVQPHVEERQGRRYVTQPPFTLAIKSTTVARDLLYQFDTVAYFRDARVAGGEEGLDKAKYVRKGPLWRAIEMVGADEPAVVLLDEIDKAPRDFPNDLLRELDQFEFEVRETGELVEVPQGKAPPIVVVTSNSEKPLPPAFLRRCVFHHIEFDEALVRKAVSTWRQAQAGDGPVARRTKAERAEELSPRDDAAVRAFMRVRAVDEMEKVPATAELLGWLAAMDARGVEASALGERVRLRDLPLLSALVKAKEDLERIRAI